MFKRMQDEISGMMVIAAADDTMGVIQMFSDSSPNEFMEASHYNDRIMEFPAYIRRRIGRPFFPPHTELNLKRRVWLPGPVFEDANYIIRGGRRHDN